MAVINYSTPGVYIEEVPSGARPIQAVGTSTAGFIGTAPNWKSDLNKPVAVNNWAEFVRRFMSAESELRQAAEEASKGLDAARSEKNAAQSAVTLLRKAAQDADLASRQAADLLTQAIAGVNKLAPEPTWKADLSSLPDAFGMIASAQAANLAGKNAYERLVRALEDIVPTQSSGDLFSDALPRVRQALSGDTVSAAQVQPVGLAQKAVMDIFERALKDLPLKQAAAATALAAAQKPDEVSRAVNSALKLVQDTLDEVIAKTPVDTGARDTLTKVIAALQAMNRALTQVKQVQDQEQSYRDGLTTVVSKLEAMNAQQGLTNEAVAATNKTYADTDLSNAVYGFFLNGGARCWIVNVGEIQTTTEDDGSVTVVKPQITGGASADRLGLDLLEEIDEVAIVAAPGYTDPEAYDAIRSHCDKLKDRVGILDGPRILNDDAMNQLLGEGGEAGDWKRPAPSKTGHLTLYTPWIYISDPAPARPNSKTPARKLVPPSGHVAGIWARSDATRGVHKAPANEPVRGALDLEKQITHQEQGLLNSGGINVIRQFRDEGILVWGARTLTSDEAWNYLNVRRLFNMIEESIAESTRWIVFEPNDRPLWQAIRRDVTAFLLGFWRDGALMGRTPEEAFYVKCDDETNPPDSIRQGRVVIEIGLAPVYPAEFVIFKISQYQAGTEVEVQSS